MALKPSNKSSFRGKSSDFASRIAIPSERTEEGLRKSQEIKEDSDKRWQIQVLIKKLKSEGFTESETLEKVYSAFPDSEYRNFFRGWVENAYKINPSKGKLPKLFDDGR